jgi:hypothetical protein
LSASHIAAILKVSRTWLFTIKKQFPEGAPKDFSDPEEWRKFVKSHRIEPIALPVKLVSTPKAEDSTHESEPSANARYVTARAHRTEILAQMAEIELAAIQRNMIPRWQVEALFTGVCTVVKGRLLRMVNDCPNALLGLPEAEIHLILMDKLTYALDAMELEKEFFEPGRFHDERTTS